MLSKPTKLVSSSYHKVTIVTTPRDLIKICTKYAIPYIEQNTGRDKVNFEFEFETESGVYFTVYDWKEYQPLKIDNEYEFHIGGVNTLDCLDGLDAFKKRV